MSTPPFYRPIANILTASAVLHSSATPSDFPGQILTVSSPPQVLLCAHRLRVVPFTVGSSPQQGFTFFQCSPSLPLPKVSSHCRVSLSAQAKSLLASARFLFVHNVLKSSSSQLSHRCHSVSHCAQHPLTVPTPSQRPIDKCLIAVAGFHFVRNAVHSSQSHRRLPLCVQLPPTVSSPMGSRPPQVSPLCTTMLSCLPISTVVFQFSSKLSHTPFAQGLITTAWFNFDLYSVTLSHSK